MRKRRVEEKKKGDLSWAHGREKRVGGGDVALDGTDDFVTVPELKAKGGVVSLG